MSLPELNLQLSFSHAVERRITLDNLDLLIKEFELGRQVIVVCFHDQIFCQNTGREIDHFSQELEKTLQERLGNNVPRIRELPADEEKMVKVFEEIEQGDFSRWVILIPVWDNVRQPQLLIDWTSKYFPRFCFHPAEHEFSV